MGRRARLPKTVDARKHRYLLFYKPYGVLSQFTPEPGSPHRCLSEFVDVPNVYAVGRLDGDSEGLMLLTSDGELQHRLTDPRYQHPRTYWVQVEGVPEEADLEMLRRGGIVIQSYHTRPAVVRKLDAAPDIPPREPPIRVRQRIPTSWLELTLIEGRNRQVRRMTAALGFPTLRLVRARTGDFGLEGLAPGEWRELQESEIVALRKAPAAAFQKPCHT